MDLFGRSRGASRRLKAGCVAASGQTSPRKRASYPYQALFRTILAAVQAHPMLC